MTAPAMTAERALEVLDGLEWCDNGCCPACGAWVGRSSKSHDCSLTQARAFFAAMVERESAMRNDAKTHGMPLPANPEPQP